MEAASQDTCDIAVVGFAFKLPQGVDDVATLWDVLANRKNLSTDWPESRINVGSISASQQNKASKDSLRHRNLESY